MIRLWHVVTAKHGAVKTIETHWDFTRSGSPACVHPPVDCDWKGCPTSMKNVALSPQCKRFLFAIPILHPNYVDCACFSFFSSFLLLVPFISFLSAMLVCLQSPGFLPVVLLRWGEYTAIIRTVRVAFASLPGVHVQSLSPLLSLPAVYLPLLTPVSSILSLSFAQAFGEHCCGAERQPGSSWTLRECYWNPPVIVLVQKLTRPC